MAAGFKRIGQPQSYGATQPLSLPLRLKAANSIAQPEGLGISIFSSFPRPNGPQLDLPQRSAREILEVATGPSTRDQPRRGDIL